MHGMVTGQSHSALANARLCLCVASVTCLIPAALLRTVATLDDCANWATTDSIGMQFEHRRCETKALDEFHVSRRPGHCSPSADDREETTCVPSYDIIVMEVVHAVRCQASKTIGACHSLSMHHSTSPRAPCRHQMRPLTSMCCADACHPGQQC